MNGGKGALPTEFILTIQNGSRPMRIVLYQVALLTSWRCGCAKLMEVIVGFWLGTTLCATTKVRLCDGMLPAPTLRIASRAKTDFGAKTSLSEKKSIRPRCSKRLLELLQLCKLCYRAFPKLRRAILRSS